MEDTSDEADSTVELINSEASTTAQHLRAPRSLGDA